MEIKLIEIRDSATFIPAMAIRINGMMDYLPKENNPGIPSRDAWIIRSAGYGGQDYLILIKLNGCEAHYDPYEWGSFRTMGNAHEYILKHWNELKSGDMVDVRTILGEQDSNPESESNNYISF